MSDVPLAIGIDFGGTSVKIGVLYRSNIIEDAPRIETQEFTDAPSLIACIAETIAELRSRYPRIAAIGCGMPGFVDFEKGIVHNLTNVVGWQDTPLKRLLSQATGLPCIIENDANAMAYAEWKRGSGRGMRHLVALTLGTGVGAGIVVNNQMLRGAQSGAGELGQTSIHYAGRRGAFGNLGALEDYIGNREIAIAAQEVYKKVGIEKTLEECEPAKLARAAAHADKIACDIWDDVAGKLATAIMNCCYLLNPQAIIIGGGVAQAGEVLFTPLQLQLKAQLNATFYDHLQILPARFGNEAGMIGAATLALEEAGYHVDD